MPALRDIFIAFLVSVVVVTLLFWKVWKSPSKPRTALLNGAVSFLTLSACLLAVEWYFRTYVIESSSWGVTLSGKVWQARYWKPINSFGYRDDPVVPAEAEGKRVVVVLGDSFAAGQGVNDYRDRFSGILASKLGPAWKVYNVSQCGWNTVQEIEALKRFPITPDVVLHSYFLNDIEDAAQRLGLTRPAIKLVEPQGLPGSVVKHSHFVNYAYWAGYRFGTRYYAQEYWDYLAALFPREDVWNEHRRELLEIVRFTKDREATLFTVIFPQTTAVRESLPMTSRVAELYREAGAKVLDLAPLLVDRSTRSLVVNSLDAHPSRELHREVGELLFEMMR